MFHIFCIEIGLMLRAGKDRKRWHRNLCKILLLLLKPLILSQASMYQFWFFVIVCPQTIFFLKFWKSAFKKRKLIQYLCSFFFFFLKYLNFPLYYGHFLWKLNTLKRKKVTPLKIFVTESLWETNKQKNPPGGRRVSILFLFVVLFFSFDENLPLYAKYVALKRNVAIRLNALGLAS